MYQHMFLLCKPSLESGFLWTAVTTSTLPAVFLVYGIFLLWRTFLRENFVQSIITTDGLQRIKKLFAPSLLARFVRSTPAMRAAGYAGFALLILCLASKRAAPFIYFQF
jgi:hypothetical protein